MATKSYNFTIDLKNPSGIAPISIVQGDTDSNIFNISITVDSKSVDLTNSTVNMVMLRPDNITVIGTCSISDALNGKITYVVGTAEQTALGSVTCSLEIVNGTIRTTSSQFKFKIIASLSSDTPIQSDTNYPVLVNLINDVQGGSVVYKPMVATYADIATTYPKPENGWTVQVTNTHTKYRWNGTAWIDIGAYQDDSIGDMGQITETSLVAAIKNDRAELTDHTSELASHASQLADITTKQGDISQLNTTDKSSVVNAIKEIKSQTNNKAEQTALDATNANVAANTTVINTHTTQISALSNGAPQAVSLVANMADHTKNYVYTGSEGGYTSGNWYYWNGSAWVSGGVYQSTAFGANSATSSVKTALGELALLLSPNAINVDFTNKIISIPAGTRIYWKNAKYDIASATNIDINISGYDYLAVFFNVSSYTFSARTSDNMSSITENDILISVLSIVNKIAFVNGFFTVNGISQNPSKSITSIARTNLGEVGIIMGGSQLPNYNSSTKKLEFNGTASFFILHRGQTYEIATGTTIDFNTESNSAVDDGSHTAGTIYTTCTFYYNTVTGKFETYSNDHITYASKYENLLLIGTYKQLTSTNVVINMASEYTINGVHRIKNDLVPVLPYVIPKSIGYVGGNAKLYYEKSGNYYYLGLNGSSISIQYVNGYTMAKQSDFDISYFQTNYPDRVVTSPLGVANCLKILDRDILYFDLISEQFVWLQGASFNSLTGKYIYPFLINNYGNLLGGELLYNNILKWQLWDTQDKVNNQLDLPQYYKDAIQTMKLKLIKSNGNLNYIVISDLHNWNTPYTQGLINQLKAIVDIANSTNIDFVAVLGDLIEIEDTKDVALDKIIALTQILGSCKKPVIFSYGNHDFNSYNDTSDVAYDKLINLSEYYNMCNAPFENQGNNSKYFYKDFVSKNVRVINLQYCDIAITQKDGGLCDISGNLDYSSTQVQWFANVLVSTPNNYKVIVLSHATLIDEANLGYVSTPASIAMVGLINAFNNKTTYANETFNLNVNYSSNTGSKVVINHYGHVHADLLAKPTSEANLVLVSTSTASSDPQEVGSTVDFTQWTTLPYSKVTARTVGTINEALFDVISVSDTQVNKYRFGAGNDGSINI